MVDMSQFPDYVQKAIGAIDLPTHARHRAQEGKKWLDHNAHYGWPLEMISIHDGKATSNVRMAYNDQNPLALAFRRVQGFQGLDGRATYATVLDKLPILKTTKTCEHWGFVEMSHSAPENVLIDKYTDGLFLDEAWAELLMNIGGEPQPVSVHFMQYESCGMKGFISGRIVAHRIASIKAA